MAFMIPDSPPTPGPGAKAETVLYEALRDSLSDEFFVYHGLHYIGSERSVEGEADFLVVHREFGLLVIECKGSGVRVTGKGTWLRILPNGFEAEMKCSPFAQAQRHIKDLVQELRMRITRQF